MNRKKGWQVWSYEWANLGGPEDALRLLFGGMTFRTKREAMAYWYDSAPGPHARAVAVRVAPR